MKYIIILGDGMADEPIAELSGKTPLQAARTPAMDRLARMGNNGLLDTIPAGMHPGSEVANLSVLGYDVKQVLEGRGSLEAASMGLEILPGEMVMRCNLICTEGGIIRSHSAGHISTGEAELLIGDLNRTFGGDFFQFYPGVSYRHILKVAGGNKEIDCTPPHDVTGIPFDQVMVKPLTPGAAETAERLNQLILHSQKFLESHPVNLKRKAAGRLPANSVWPWSPGYKPQMEKLSERYPLRSGAVISAVDLIRGIGVYAGLEVIEVPGATGLYDTNYEGKVQAALKALRNNDFVYMHIEASDEAGHEGDVALKIRTIEDLDQRIVRPVLEEIERWNEAVAVALLPDHPTPCRLKTHTNDPVPFVIFNPRITPDNVQVYDEFSARKGRYGLLRGDEFIKHFLSGE